MRKTIPIIIVVLVLACAGLQLLATPSGDSCAAGHDGCTKKTATPIPATNTPKATVTSTLWTPLPPKTVTPEPPSTPEGGGTGELCCIPYDTVCEPFESAAFIEHHGDVELLERHKITDIAPQDVAANLHCRKLKPGRYITAFWSDGRGGHANLQPREVTVYEGLTTVAVQPNSPYTK